MKEHGDLKCGKAYVSEWARIQEAIIAVADADSEDDRAARRAQVRFMKTLKDLGWRKVERRRVVIKVSAQLALLPREEWGG